MYTLINGSCKTHSSNSLYFLETISSKLNNYSYFELKKDSYEEIIDECEKSLAVVLAFPLYVDSPTSITLEFLDYIVDKNIRLDGKLIYAIINCGFREGEQNITAVNIIKRWCEKVGATYGCSIMIGAGEIVGKKKFKFVSQKALKELNKFADIVQSGKRRNDIITTMDLLNNKMYCFLANLSWNKKARVNNLSKVDLNIK